MHFTMKHGAKIETLTPGEAEHVIRRVMRERHADQPKRVRTEMVINVPAVESVGVADAFVVPVGYEFEVRRVFIGIMQADPVANFGPNAAGQWIEYRRSGDLIEYGLPVGPTNAVGVPGIQTWGAQQGPYLSNGEIFQVAVIFPAGAPREWHVKVEGIVSRGYANR